MCNGLKLTSLYNLIRLSSILSEENLFVIRSWNFFIRIGDQLSRKRLQKEGDWVWLTSSVL
jgi:hypothetical protein